MCFSGICTYVDLTPPPQEEKVQFYDCHEEAFRSQKSYYTIVMENVNANVGSDGVNRACSGKYTSADSNGNGEMFINFLEKGNMKLVFSFSRKSQNRRRTWSSPDGRRKNDTDHLAINDIRIVKNIEIIPTNGGPQNRQM